MTTTDTNTHILVFPYPAQGHMLPLLDLTHHLSLHGLTITILITPKNLPYLSSLLSTHPSTITPLILPFPSHPSIPPGIEHVKDLGHSGNLAMLTSLFKLYDPLLHWFTSHPNPPVAIISDFFLGWTYHLALRLNISRLAFFPSGAFFASIDDYIWNDVERCKPLDEIELCSLPGSHVFKADHLPSLFRLYQKSDPNWEPVKDGKIANTRSWGCVFNSFDALEGEYMDYLKKKLGHDRIFGVGPLNLAGPDYFGRGNAGSGSDANDRVLTWLDACRESSVLYVCFGSQKLLRREQMEALAVGLEKSGTRFLWVVKTGTTRQQDEGFGVLPDGFEERVVGRGLVIREWAPQVLILSHRAVGGFLSHCGWNSVLEGIAGGVVVLAWPMEADQFVNARLLVEDIGMGVRVCEGADAVPDSTELGRVVSESMSDGGRMKERAKGLKDEALGGVTNGGSSAKDLVRLVGELFNLQVR
ncbi:PREDICTED: UDP-glycosyltransferase 89A2 [Theobroma cacao]|uniref:UDP-glycosyltransferase 89A2 n=1 Tax=Theobroma cacao TaxID=3641 RepID=A0AB32VL75_THECC|nr:PREDICTED: UDP-glycosyltransferase 89A2 [Theobroma cacao]